MTTFQEFAAKNLQAFGWSVTADDIADYDTYRRVIKRLGEWWERIDHETRDIIRSLDLAPGLWDKGYFAEWPAAYQLMAGNPMGGFDSSYNDIVACLRRAHEQVEEQTEPVSDVRAVVGD